MQAHTLHSRQMLSCSFSSVRGKDRRQTPDAGSAARTRDDDLGCPKLWSFAGADILAHPFRPKVIPLHLGRH